MDKASCVILGTAKNIAKHLPQHLQTLEEIRSLWASCAVVIGENGSTDGTKALLETYAKKPLTHVLTLDAEANPIQSRTERLALVRNRLIDYVHTTYPTSDYILIADMDGILDGFHARGLKEAFKSSDWDAVFANTMGAYYDIWALRSEAISYDCWDLVRHFMQQGFDRGVAKAAIITPHQVVLPKKPTLIPVQSAFGGLGLYRLAKTRGCRYDGLTRACSCTQVNQFTSPCAPERCEHVAFHQDMIEKHGAKLFIHTGIQVKPALEHL
jgi:hypothetical protein